MTKSERIIKFRCWDPDKKEMYIPAGIIFGNDGNSSPLLYTARHSINLNDLSGSLVAQLTPQDGIIMQFTGMYDVLGEKIYEGDIISYPDDPEDTSIIFSEVYFEDGAFYVKTGFDFYNILGELDCEEYVKVIGNIYENHVLKGKNVFRK